MKIQKDTVVTLQYQVAEANGKPIEASKDPMVYLHGGYENTLPKIEAALEGQEPGYSLEVFNALGETVAVVTVRESQIEPLRADELLAVRTVSAAA